MSGAIEGEFLRLEAEARHVDAQNADDFAFAEDGARPGAGEAQFEDPLIAAEREAAALLEATAWGVSQLFPELAYRAETKAEGAKKLAPLLLKYDVAGTLFARWGAEIEAGMFFGGVIFASVKAVKAARAKEKAEEPEGASDGK